MTDEEFREAYGQHKHMLYRFARRMTGSATIAEDLVHDCFLMLWRNAVSFDRERGTLRNFLIGVIRNLEFKRLRKELTFDELQETAICEPIDPAGREHAEMVEHAVSKLPPLTKGSIDPSGVRRDVIGRDHTRHRGRISGCEIAAASGARKPEAFADTSPGNERDGLWNP